LLVGEAQEIVPTGHGPNGCRQSRQWNTFGEEALGACAPGALTLLVAGMHGNDDRFRPGADLADCLDAIASGHLDVHHADLGGLVVEQFTQFGAGGGYTDDTSVRETVQRLAEPLCKE